VFQEQARLSGCYSNNRHNRQSGSSQNMKSFKAITTIMHEIVEACGMDRAKVVKEELFGQDTPFLAVYVESKNSCLVMLSEKEDRMGTLAVAVPKPNNLLGPVTSSVLLGNRNVVSARMFAEYVAVKKGKIALVSVYLDKISELEAQAFFMHLIEKVLQAESRKEAEKI
jgi:hypothetical protein